MSISVKSERELESMRIAGRIVGNTLQMLRAAIEPGITTKELDRLGAQDLRRQGAEPAFPHINHFPGTVCISVNEEVVHGIPGKRRLREGDIVKLDVGAIHDGFHGDAAITVPVGEISKQARQLVDATEHCLQLGIQAAGPGAFLNDIGAAIEAHIATFGYSAVRQYVGHGIGRGLHEEPNVPHYRQPSRGLRLRPGMTFTIEPMINEGTYDTRMLADGWTVVTADGRLSAQFEHTVAITDDGHEILTLPSGGTGWAVPIPATNIVQ